MAREGEVDLFADEEPTQHLTRPTPQNMGGQVQRAYVPTNVEEMRDDQVDAELARMMQEDGGSAAEYQKLGQEQRQAELADTKAKLKAEHAAFVKDNQPLVGEGTLGVIEGVASGFREVHRKLYNGLVTFADVAENTLAKVGIGSGDIISEKNLNPDFLKPVKDVTDIKNSEIAKTITQVAVPLVYGVGAAAAIKGGVLAMGAADASINFLLSSKDDGNLSNLLEDTWVKELPLAVDVMGALKVNPDDTELSARLKGVVEGGILGLAIGGAVKGVKAARGRKAAEAVEAGVKEIEAGKNAEAAVTAGKMSSPEWRKKAAKATAEAEQGAPLGEQKPVQVGGGDRPATVDPNIPSGDAPAGTKIAPVSEPAPAKAEPIDGQITFDQWVERAQKEAKPEDAVAGKQMAKALEPAPFADESSLEQLQRAAEGVADKRKLRTKLTDAQLKQAAKALEDDPETMQRIGNWHEGQGPLTDVDTLVLVSKIQEADAAFTQAIKEAKPENAAGFMRSFLGFMRMAEISTGSASAKGATLRVEELISRAMGTRTEEGLKILGTRGRAALMQKLVESFGGQEAVESMMNGLKYMGEKSGVMTEEALKAGKQAESFLEQAAKIMQRTDNSFYLTRSGVGNNNLLRAGRDFVVKGMFNSMLSGVGTIYRATVGAGAATIKTALDVNIMALTPGMSTTIREAVAYDVALLNNMMKSFQVAGDAFMRPGDFGHSFKFDLDTGVTAAVTREEAARRSALSWASVYGFVDKAIEVPTRILVSGDVYFNHLQRSSWIEKEAYAAAMHADNKATVKAMGGVENFVEGFVKNPPANVVQQADQIARTNTLSNDLVGAPEAVASGLSAAADIATLRTGFGKVIFPFLRSTFNEIAYAVHNSPLAPLSPQFYKDVLSNNPKVREMAFTKAVSGGVMLAPLMLLASQNKLWGGDAEEAKLMNTVGAGAPLDGPAIKVGDTWVSVKGIPLVSSLVKVTHTLSKVSGYLDKDEYMEAFAAGVGGITAALTPDMVFQTVSSLIKIANGQNPEEASKFASQLSDRMVPYGALLKSIRNETDPNKRYTWGDDFYSTVMNMYKNRIPGMSTDNPFMRDRFGHRMIIPDGVGPNDIGIAMPSDPEKEQMLFALRRIKDFADINAKSDTLGELVFELEKPSYTQDIEGKGVRLSNQEYSDYMMALGGMDPYSGQPYSKFGGTIFEKFQAVMKEHNFYDRDPLSMDRAEYTKFIRQLREVENESNAMGRTFLNDRRTRERIQQRADEIMAKGAQNVLGE